MKDINPTFKSLPKEEIIAIVDQNPGTWRDITYIGARAPYEGDIEAIITITRNVRFCKHGNTKIAKFEKAVRDASTIEDLVNVSIEYDKMDAYHKACVSDHIIAILNSKKDAIKKGEEFGVTDKKAALTRIASERHYLIYCKNDAVLLQLHNSFKKNIKTGEYVKPIIRYFLKKGDEVKELVGTSPAALAKLDTIRSKVLVKAGKDMSSKPTAVRSIHIENVIDIN